MGIFSGRSKAASLAAAALKFVSNNPDKVKNGIAKVGNIANEKTHGKYSSHISGAQAKAAQAIDKANRRKGSGGDGPTFPPSN